MAKCVFISFPYTHEDKAVIDERVKHASAYAMHLKIKGEYTPFAPAIMGHCMLTSGEDASFQAWREMCMDYLDVCEEMHVIYNEGIITPGMQAEIDRAEQLGIRVLHVKWNQK